MEDATVGLRIHLELAGISGNIDGVEELRTGCERVGVPGKHTRRYNKTFPKYFISFYIRGIEQSKYVVTAHSCTTVTLLCI